jgi:hypothetical protein
MAAYHTLEDWVQTTLANNPHLRDRAQPPSAPAPAAASAPAVDAAAQPPAGGRFAAARPAPAKPTTPVDEFDPLPFNRQGKADASKDDDDKP